MAKMFTMSIYGKKLQESAPDPEAIIILKLDMQKRVFILYTNVYKRTINLLIIRKAEG